MSNVLSQASHRLDLEWEYGDPVSLDFILEEFDVSGPYDCIIRNAERGGAILAQPSVATTYIPNDGTNFLIQMTAAEAIQVPIGYWWYSLSEVNGVTRFSGRLKVLDGGHRVLSYEATLDTTITATTELEEIAP